MPDHGRFVCCVVEFGCIAKEILHKTVLGMFSLAVVRRMDER